MARPGPSMTAPAPALALGTVCALILLWSSVAAALDAQWCKIYAKFLIEILARIMPTVSLNISYFFYVSFPY